MLTVQPCNPPDVRKTASSAGAWLAQMGSTSTLRAHTSLQGQRSTYNSRMVTVVWQLRQQRMCSSDYIMPHRKLPTTTRRCCSLHHGHHPGLVINCQQLQCAVPGLLTLLWLSNVMPLTRRRHEQRSRSHPHMFQAQGRRAGHGRGCPGLHSTDPGKEQDQ